MTRSSAGASGWRRCVSSAGRRRCTSSSSARLSEFLGTDDTILFSSCFDANGGLFEALLGAEDAIVSDALNHASIIDGIRLCKAQRLRYANGDLGELEARLEEAAGAKVKMIATDGVFSMDGHIADLRGICDVAERHGALVMVDDSHAVGFVGPNGRGTPELHGVTDRVDVVTGTLGKAMGGAVRRLRLRPERDHRDAAAAGAAVPVLEQRRAADRRGGAEGDRARRGLSRAARAGCGRTRRGSARRWRRRASTSSRAPTRSCR